MKKILYIFAILLLASCAADDPTAISDTELGDDVDTSLGIATEGTTVNADPNELIHSWWVAFVAPDHHIEAIVERHLGKPVTDDYAKLTIPSGRYLLVAFANRIPTLDDDGETYVYQSLKFKKGAASPVIDADDKTLWTDFAPEQWSSSELVPMSGLRQVTVTGRQGEQIDLEVVRQVARIELRFENIGKRPVTVNSYRIVKFKSSEQYLFPCYDRLGSTPKLPTTSLDEMVDVSRTFGQTMAPQATASDMFYNRESTALIPTGVYTIFLNVTHHEGLGWNATTDELSAPLSDISYVTRNDLIRIPIRLTDYLISLEALFYPPIGGYPAVMTDMGAGNYYVRFGSQGVFTIRPHVRKAVALSDPEFGELSNAYLNMQIVSIEGDPIFIEEPQLDINHDIIGQIGTTKGQARVTLSFDIPEASGSNLSYTRSILIIRD